MLVDRTLDGDCRLRLFHFTDKIWSKCGPVASSAGFYASLSGSDRQPNRFKRTVHE
jgi:hypothetical protein